MDLVTIDTSGCRPIVKWDYTREIPQAFVHDARAIIHNHIGYILTVSRMSIPKYSQDCQLIHLRGLVLTSDNTRVTICRVCKKYASSMIYANENRSIDACMKCYREACNVSPRGTDNVLAISPGRNLHKQLIKVYGMGNTFYQHKCNMCGYDEVFCNCELLTRQIFIDLRIHAYMTVKHVFAVLECMDVFMVILRMLIRAN